MEQDEIARKEFVDYLSHLKNNGFVIGKTPEISIMNEILRPCGFDLENMISYFKKEIEWIKIGKHTKPDDRLDNRVSGGRYVSYPIDAAKGQSFQSFSNRLMNIYFTQANGIFYIYHFEIYNIKKPSLHIKEISAF